MTASHSEDACSPSPFRRSWRDRIVRAALLVAFAHFLVKVISLLQNRYLGHYFSPADRDFFIALYKVIFTSIFLIGEEALGPIFLPAFMTVKEKDGDAAAWRFASVVFNGYFLVLLVVGVIMLMDPVLVIRIWTQWTADSHAEHIQLAQRTVPILVPGLIAISLGSLTYLLLNAHESFFWAAWGDGVVKVFILAGIIVGGIISRDHPGTPLAADGLTAIIVGVSAGGIGKLVLHLCALGPALGKMRLTLCAQKHHICQFMWLMTPLLLGIVFAKVRDGFNQTWLLSDYKGLISANAFGKTIADSIHYLVPYAVSIALLPYFCMLAADNDDDKFAEILGNSTRALLFLFVPVSLILIVVAFPLTVGFYETGRFTDGDSRLTAVANACYVSGLAFAALEAVFMQAFFSRRSVWTPIIVGMLCSLLSMAISYIGIRILNVEHASILAVVAGGFVFSRAVKTAILGMLLCRKVNFLNRDTAGETAKAVLLGGIVALVSAYVLLSGFQWLLNTTAPLHALFDRLPKMVSYLALSGVTGGLSFSLFVVVSCRAGLPEPRWLYFWSVEKYPQLSRLPLERLLFGTEKS